MWFDVEHRGAGLRVGLNDLKGLFSLSSFMKVPISELVTLTSPSVSGEKYLVR